MNQHMKCFIILLTGAALLIGSWMILFVGILPSAYAFTSTPLQATAPVLPTLTAVSTNVGGTSSGLDSTLLAALIGLGGVFTGLLVSIVTTIYQARQNERIQRELARHNEQLQRDLLRAQKDLEREHALRERQEQQEDALANAEAKRQCMLRAFTNEERARLYRDALQGDPHIAILQILDMKRPLEIANVYVRLRVHQGMQQGYGLDSLQQGIVIGHDPNDLLLIERQRQEQLFSKTINPEAAIHRYTRCVILGDPGAGKTTLLKYLTLTSAKGPLEGLPDLLPIYVELNAFANSHGSDLLDYVATTWDSFYAFPSEQARLSVANQLNEGKALLLLDALDETVVGETAEAAEQAYSRVSRIILQIATRYPRAPIVVTARKAGYRQRAPLVGFTELEVIDFRAEDSRQFIRNWYAHSQDLHGQSKCDDLIQRLERNQRLQVLATNPLLLTLIVLVYEAQLDLPERRAELYKQCVETLLTKWDAKRNIRRRREFKPEYKRHLLEIVAWDFHTKGQRYFPEHELLRVIATFLPAVGLSSEQHTPLLQEIVSEQGLLKEQAQGWYGFLHLTLQEYFAALYAADYHQLEELLSHRGDPWWEEVVLLYAGHVSDASQLFQTLLGQNSEQPLKEDLFSTNLVLAGRCLATRPTLWQISLREEVVSRLFQTLQSTKYSLTKRHMADVLAGIGGIEVNRKLIHLLSDERLDGDMRKSIATALGSLGERSVVPELIHLLSDEGVDTDVRASIATALGSLGERSVVPELMHLLSDEGVDTDVRASIATALGSLGERSVVPELMHLLSDEGQNEDVRYSIVTALKNLGERTVVPGLMRLLADDKLAGRMRAAITKAIGELAERSMIPELIHLLIDDNLEGNGRVDTAEAISDVEGHSMTSELVPLLSNETLDANVRERIIEWLGRSGERSIAPYLMSLLVDESLDQKVIVTFVSTDGSSSTVMSMSMRAGIAYALGNLGERSVVPNLVRLLADEKLDAYVRASIALAVGKLGECSVVPELVRYFFDAKWLGWLIAIEIGNLGERSVIPDLVCLLPDESLDKEVRCNIATALGKLGERSVVPDLVCLLADEGLDVRVRSGIALAVRELEERSVVPELARLLSDERLDRDVQTEIARTIGALAEDEVTATTLANYLNTLDNADHIYHALWNVSCRARVRVFTRYGPDGEEVVEVINETHQK